MKKIIFLLGIFLSSAALSKDIKNYENLIESSDVRVYKNGRSSSIRTQEVKVLTEAGRTELSLYRIQYDKVESQFHLLEASTTNGKDKFVISESKLKIGNVNTDKARGGMVHIEEVLIPLENVQVGSVVRVQYEIESRPTVGNIFSFTSLFSNGSLAKKEWTKIVSDLPLNTYEENFGQYYLVEKSQRNGKFIIDVKPSKKGYDFEGVKVEASMLGVTTAQNWRELESILTPGYEKALRVNLPLKLQNLVTESEKLKTKKEIIEYVAKGISQLVGYSGNWTTKQGQYFPAGIQKVITQGKGDCKDYSTLMTAVLRKLKFEAYPFLTFRSQGYAGKKRLTEMAKTPNPQYFNHIIVWAKDSDGKEWWIDPTNPHVQADVVTSDILGNFGLLLDGKGGKTLFLPEQNQMPSDFTMEHTLIVGGDNAVSGQGAAIMSASSFNMIAMVERMYGQEGIKGVFRFMLNPSSQKTNFEIPKTDSENMKYEYTLRATDWVREEIGKFKIMTLFNPVGLLLQRLQKEKDGDLGEVGTTKVITHLKGQKIVDSVRAGCLIRSKWFDTDRYVDNKSDEVTVTDVIKTKVRFIDKEEAKGDYFDSMLGEVIGCAKNSALVLKLSDSLKTAQDIEEDKLKGPDLEFMTDADAEALHSMSGQQLFGYRNLKMYRYYERRTIANPKDAFAYNRMAESLAWSGYLKGDDFVPEYLSQAIGLLDIALKNSENGIFPQASGNKIRYLLYQNKKDEAADVFMELYKKAPGDIVTYRAAYRIESSRKNWEVAEKWLKSSQALAKTEEDKKNHRHLMAEVLEHQKKYKEAIVYHEEDIKANPRDAWGLHNLAVLYGQIPDMDKVIEYEQKALDVSDFGAARKVLSQAYYEKARNIMLEEKQRKPASSEDYEKYLLESVKYHENTLALGSLAELYLAKYTKTKDKGILAAGKEFLDRAADKEPGDPGVQKMMELYTAAKNAG